MNKKVPVITLDGPSGTGKGTLCHLLAGYLKWHFLDSGAIYRVLALAVDRANIPLEHISGIVEKARTLPLRFVENKIYLEEEAVETFIRSQNCAQTASILAALPEVRVALLERQRAFAEFPGLVTDGRDMGTVVFPDAELKIYLDATPEARAHRRYLQLKKSGKNDTLAQVVEDLSLRDARDMNRKHAPLAPAQDAVLMDTTHLSVEEVFQSVLQLVYHRGLGEKQGESDLR